MPTVNVSLTSLQTLDTQLSQPLDGGKQKKDKEGWGRKRGDDGKMKKGANEGKKTRRAE